VPNIVDCTHRNPLTFIKHLVVLHTSKKTNLTRKNMAYLERTLEHFSYLDRTELESRDGSQGSHRLRTLRHHRLCKPRTEQMTVSGRIERTKCGDED
jgi:uncharacterized HAD superfamily protein